MADIKILLFCLCSLFRHQKYSVKNGHKICKTLHLSVLLNYNLNLKWVLDDNKGNLHGKITNTGLYDKLKHF